MPERSRGALVLAGAALVFALAFSSACGPKGEDRAPGLRHVYANELRAGPERAIAERRCLSCHSATLLTQQRKDSTAWAKTVAQMEYWGAPVAAGERDSLLAYLVRELGVR